MVAKDGGVEPEHSHAFGVFVALLNLHQLLVANARQMRLRKGGALYRIGEDLQERGEVLAEARAADRGGVVGGPGTQVRAHALDGLVEGVEVIRGAAARQHGGDKAGQTGLVRGFVDGAARELAFEHDNGRGVILAHEQNQAVIENDARDVVGAGHGVGLHASPSSGRYQPTVWRSGVK